jgi:hypothetical protein
MPKSIGIYHSAYCTCCFDSFIRKSNYILLSYKVITCFIVD